MIAQAMAASAGMARTPSGTRPSSPHSHGESGSVNWARSALSCTGCIPVSRDSGGAGVSPSSIAWRNSIPGPAARIGSG
jgi:hypothetical protein